MVERRLRVCIPIDGVFDAIYGGGQVYVRNLANALCRKGHDVTVLECLRFFNETRESGLQNETYDRDGIRLLRLHLPPGHGRDGQGQVEAVVRAGIVRAAPDIVHANGMKMLVARVCAGMHIPCVVTAHHGGIVCPAGTLLDYNDEICRRPVDQEVCARCCVSQQPLAPLWRMVLSLVPVWIQLTIGRFLRRIPLIPYVTPALIVPLQVFEKKQEVEQLLTKARYIVAPSKAMQTALLLNGSRPERTVLIQHGIPELEKADFQVESAPHVVRFAYVGRLNRVKGLHVLVQAFNRLNGSVELHVIGTAKTKSERRYWASVLRQVECPERVIQHGYLVGADYRRVVGECDAVILPSIYLETFGLTVAEAFSLGRPVITTDCGGPAEQVRNGVDGVVVPRNNVAVLAEAMQEFLSDPNTARNLAGNIRDPISVEQHVDALMGLYLSCITQGT